MKTKIVLALFLAGASIALGYELVYADCNISEPYEVAVPVSEDANERQCGGPTTVECSAVTSGGAQNSVPNGGSMCVGSINLPNGQAQDYVCNTSCGSSSSKEACVLKENPDTGAEYCNPFACIGPKKCRLFSPQLKYGLSYQEFTEAWGNPESPFYHYGRNSTAYFGWLVFTTKKCACATQATVDAYYDTSTTSGSSGESSPEPTPTPTVPEITSFEITNFKKQQSGSGLEYYQCLKEQMAIQHPDYQLNLVWEVMGADSCTASCKYARVDDYLQNQDFGALPGQAWDCSSDIDGNVTFSGSVDNVSGSAKTKPRENGVIQYALSCESDGGSDTEYLTVVVQDFKWFERIV